MSSVIRRGGVFAVALLAGSLFLARSSAGDGDLIKETQERLKVEAERLERLVSDATNRAETLGPRDPMRAIEILREAKAQLEADKEALKPERREVLLRRILVKMRGYSERADNPIITPGTIGSTRQSEADRVRNEEARRQQEAASRRVNGGKDNLRELSDLRNMKAEALLKENEAVIKSSMPPGGDYTFPRDWAEKMAKRKTGIKLTEEEKKIVKALNTIMPIELEGKTFKEVLDYIREKSGVPIVVDQRALDDLNITYNSMVTVNLGKVTMRTVLKRVLGDLSLTYVMKDQAIQVTTPARAKDMLTTRMYSVADLMPLVDLRFNPLISQLQAMDTIQRLIVLITQTTEPDSWEVNGKGGLGTIGFYAPTMSLVVKQTAEMHYLMGLSGH